jgi:Phage integrase, N-terminal SAM-like domain
MYNSAQFANRWRVEVLAKRKPSTVCSASSHLNSHIIPQLGKLRPDQVGPENQQIFVNQFGDAARGAKPGTTRRQRH